jgi:hypothetical protein
MAIKVQGDIVIFDDKTIRPGRFTTAERNAISTPNTGMIVYDTDVSKAFVYNGTSWVNIVSATPVGIATPTVTVEGSPSSVPEDPTITTSAFALTSGSDNHYATDWEIERTANSEIVFSSNDDTVNLTSITLSEGILEENEEYEFRARHKTLFFESAYGSVTANTLVSFSELAGAVFGDAACGGFYIGTICAASTCYAIIVAPNATGCAACQWKTTQTTTSGTTSCVDGRSNTYGPMDNATHPAGNWTATRTINGFSDWYLPARDELSQLYTNKGPLPAGEGFAAVIYWSSTESSAAYACFQLFANGGMNPLTKPCSCRVRAVRREPI